MPLLYFLRIDGIVPTLLVYYGVTCLFTILFRVKDIPKVPINLHDAWHEGSGMMRLGRLHDDEQHRDAALLPISLSSISTGAMAKTP